MCVMWYAHYDLGLENHHWELERDGPFYCMLSILNLTETSSHFLSLLLSIHNFRHHAFQFVFLFSRYSIVIEFCLFGLYRSDV